ncbi:hypothetical protein [Methylocapsa acidiphila]|uniref:hypothetical protein n=1 Tax=Methylocapsa acidiphila TaxID=133552 RepID=UPI00041B4747|nr:hypothetical protein [Methylocapsa acidiphila]
MHNLSTTAAALIVAAAAAGVSGSAEAGPMQSARLGAATDAALFHQAQFVWGGRDYCFYSDGWRGPGFYWCGYRWRRGHGWGGGSGWHGWTPGQEGHWRGGERNRVGRGGPGEDMDKTGQGRSVSPGPQNGAGMGHRNQGAHPGDMGTQGRSVSPGPQTGGMGGTEGRSVSPGPQNGGGMGVHNQGGGQPGGAPRTPGAAGGRGQSSGGDIH